MDHSTNTAQSRSPTRVLLIEDDPGDAFLVQQMLQAAGHVEFTVETVATAAAAVAKLDQGGIDVAILDLGLPDSDGFDTLLRFRTCFPNLPVVVLTGVDDESIGLRAVECGAQDYVAKGLVVGQILLRAVTFAIARQNRIGAYKAEARTDALTGLANRRAFDDEISRRVAEADRHDRPLSLIMLDIDHFKELNDARGHRTGDFVLCQLGKAISQSIRKGDIAARYGGEELAVVLPDTDLACGLTVAQRLLKAVAEPTEFEGRAIEVTVSIGFAEREFGDGAAPLVERADAALYFAKEAGRNRVAYREGATHHQLLPEPAAAAV